MKIDARTLEVDQIRRNSPSYKSMQSARTCLFIASWPTHTALYAAVGPRRVDGFAGPLAVEQFKGGQSNPTYRLVTPQRSYVLRRKPPGELLKGAHAIEREAQVLTALAGTGVPVPQVFGLCTDDSVIGNWFYVMGMVEGRIFWDATFPGVPRADRAAYFDAMNAAIACLHSVDYVFVGLGQYGRPGSY